VASRFGGNLGPMSEFDASRASNGIEGGERSSKNQGREVGAHVVRTYLTPLAVAGGELLAVSRWWAERRREPRQITGPVGAAGAAAVRRPGVPVGRAEPGEAAPSNQWRRRHCHRSFP